MNTKQILELNDALRAGKKLQFFRKEQWVDISRAGWDVMLESEAVWDLKVRIAPEYPPGYRPWVRGEAPVGCVVRLKGSLDSTTLLASRLDGVGVISEGQYHIASYDWLLANAEWNYIGAGNGSDWKLCGVKIGPDEASARSAEFARR